MPEIKFGTDGWRGIIGDNYTFKNVRIVSQAVADYLGQGKKVAIGYDTRFMSGKFARTCAEVLVSNGIEVLLSDRPTPTPTLSFAVKQRKFDLGVMITASHNPSEYNGFKIKTSTGGGAGPEVTAKVEELLNKSQVASDKSLEEKIKTEDITTDYIKFIRSYIDFKKIKNKKFKVLIDAMYGSGDTLFADILKGTGIRLEFMRNTINPSFEGGRPEPVEDNLKELKRRVKEGKFDLGIALDGDADRLAAVAPGGVFIHPQKILGLLALHLSEDRRWSGGIVKTLCGTNMMDAIAEYLGVELYETPVGFKYISNLMETKDIVCGGEEAGGMGVKNYIPERDGTVAGLLLLEMMVYRHKNILKIYNEMEKQFGKYYYVRDDLHLANKVELRKEDLPNELLGRPVVEVKAYDGFKLICDDGSWLMFRGSGTEPLMRLYAESKNLTRAKKLLALGRKVIGVE
ncbi:MAG: phosphoglucomutase/phosphomannomutase family protein [Candidatus Omnitrophica bacterium]|nr:phosphoglucomutase/phosphomannomutase family protein [Candidatus Omnitrophota bacterium]MBU1870486.1 phosphoglucomutase/phosphomannomutase family protein [Candidatus Omnitrophota bacterium]